MHIFEERYKEMVGEAIRARTEFGIVLAKNDGIVNTGCTVSVEQVVTEYPDGRLDVLTKGRRRFEIIYLDQEKAYLRGHVEFFDDDHAESIPPELQDQAVRGFRRLSESGSVRANAEPSMNDPQLSFQLAQAIEDLDFQSTLLRSRSEAERLRRLNEFLEEYIPRMKHATRMKHLAPMNGFGQKQAGV